MRFGLFGGPARRAEGASDPDTYRAYIDAVVEAESLGFYATYLVEHHFTGRGQVSASLSLLAHVAALTSSIRLGTAVVVVPWHNPVLLAEQAATVDLLSGGRLDLGLGRGYRENEFHGFGVPREEAETRFQETVDVLRKAWTSDERFSHHGAHWSYHDIVVEPKPVQRPHPPLWVGAASARSIGEAGQRNFRLFLDQVATFEEIGARLACYRAARQGAGLDYQPTDVAVTRPLLLAENDGHRAELLDSHLGTLAYLADSASSTHNPFYSDPQARLATAEGGAIIGTADECVERLRRLQDLGVQQVLFTRTTPQALRRFAREVMPAFAAS